MDSREGKGRRRNAKEEEGTNKKEGNGGGRKDEEKEGRRKKEGGRKNAKLEGTFRSQWLSVVDKGGEKVDKGGEKVAPDEKTF